MNIVLFDTKSIRETLLPFTFTRPIGNIRIGILTLAEKWEFIFKNAEVSFLTQPYLQTKFPMVGKRENLFINGALIPDENNISEIAKLKAGHGLDCNGKLLAVKLTEKKTKTFVDNPGQFEDYQATEYRHSPTLLMSRYGIVALMRQQLEQDFRMITRRRKSAQITDRHSVCYGKDIFIEPGARVKNAVLNSETGPIYLGHNAEVHEGALIRGPFSLNHNAQVQMGGIVRGFVSVGPFTRIGGEVSNSVLFGYTNKIHDGYLGDSVLGEWCNLGAGTNVSNLKNNYSPVRQWNYATESFEKTGMQFCGLMMGDHSKSGIGVSFNTATVVGCSANIFGADLPAKFIPSFSWGSANKLQSYEIDKAMSTASRVMSRRGIKFDDEDEAIFNYIYKETAEFRNFKNINQKNAIY